jgi:hypothetical protein
MKASAFRNFLCTGTSFLVGGTKKKKSSIVYQQFMGSMRIHTRKILPTDIDAAKRAELLRTGEYEWRVSSYM